MECPECQRLNPEDAKFCNECGCNLNCSQKALQPGSDRESERKHVTVMFCDLSGYTAITERLDPEEVKEIMSHVFGKITEIISGYGGFIERFIGDAVMSVFGVPQAHEDDPIRAIRAAIEIRTAVEKLSPQFESKIGHYLSVHTGINTGLVVTGEVDVQKGTHGLTGDAINLASRLEGLAEAGEIIVGPDTYSQAYNFFEFTALAPASIKGKQQPVKIYKCISAKKESSKTHRLQGLQAALTGRDREMAILNEAVERLKQGQGSIISIIGDAGTGKSRLKKEFKDALGLNGIQWREGHAYGYTQNMPYYPLINLLTRAFQIEENDSPEEIRRKLETSVALLLGENNVHTPYIGTLFSLSYPQVEKVSPEFWKDRLMESIQAILSALVDRKPTIICFEDLHWADPSFIDLFKRLAISTHRKALFICTYRPLFSLFKDSQLNELKTEYLKINLKDLAGLEAKEMLKSLLRAQKVPLKLNEVIGSKAEGNPFYIEEMINSLIESEILICENGEWKLSRDISETDIPPTIHGILTARVDRLQNQFKRVLQEASVIGRAFLHKILKTITEVDSELDKYLFDLENLDLIRTRSLAPELEYIFKHALTQEVIYSGILKKERQEIHERIAIVIERLFHDRLPEFYETLAFHFSKGLSINKAIHYLMKSGKKSLSRYSIEESHEYYKHAYEILRKRIIERHSDEEILIKLLVEWAYVLYYRGHFKEMAEIFFANIKIAESLEDKAKLGIYYSWCGWSLFNQNYINKSYPFLQKSLHIGKEIKDNFVIGYACTWLTWYYAAVGKIDDSIRHGEWAQEISKEYKSDAYLFFKSLGGLGFAYCAKGDKNRTIEIGNELIDFGNRNSNIRSLTIGYGVLGAAYHYDNDLTTAIEAYEKAVQVGVEPYYVEFIRMNLVTAYIMNGQINEAENAIDSVVKFSQGTGAWIAGTPARAFLGAVMISKGQMGSGLKQLKEGKQKLNADGSMFYGLVCEFILAKVFSQIAEKSEPITLWEIAKNIGFLAKYIFIASKKAERHYKNVIKISEKFGAKSIMGGACLDLGIFYMTKKQKDMANDYLYKATILLKECGSDVYLKQANEVQSSLQ